MPEPAVRAARLVKHRFEVSGGRLEVVARDEGLLAAARALCERLTADERAHNGAIAIEGTSAWLKAGPLRASSARRWALRALFLRHGPPRKSEYENLLWLRERLFLAPEPLAAAWLMRGGLPRYQMLVTERIEGAPTLDELLRRGDPALPRRALLALADVASRLHALHFVHRDLYPRNVLVRERADGNTPELWLIDAWRGGERLQTRGAAYDVACLLLRAPESIGQELQTAFLDAYARGRERQGKPLRSRERFAADVARERRALAARLLRKPDEWRGDPAPRLDWNVV